MVNRNTTSADAGVASKSTPPAGVDSSTSTAGGVLKGTASADAGVASKSTPPAVVDSSTSTAGGVLEGTASADAGVASKSTPPAGVDSSTSAAGGVLEGTAPPVGGADAESAPTMGGASSRVVPGAPTAGVGVCDNLESKGKCKVASTKSKGERDLGTTVNSTGCNTPEVSAVTNSEGRVGCNTQEASATDKVSKVGCDIHKEEGVNSPVTGLGNKPMPGRDIRESKREKGPVGTENSEEDLRINLPEGYSEEEDSRRELAKRQNLDGTLAECKLLAESGLRGYGLRQGVLVHVIVGDCGEECVRIVVPQADRERILRVAHDGGGHLGVRKTRDRLNRLFTWPGMARDISHYVESCPLCLKANKAGNKPVKLMERPVVDEPFRVVAVDIVGPLPKGKGGAQYLLTYACMATRWPEAIPLRNVTANEVSEAFCQIVCKTGLPDTVLTDRGAVFTGKVFRKTCELFGCGQITTTPYHPQGNGVVERLHGTLKPMLAKASLRGIDWVRFLPIALFALRQMPHRDSGLSPFDLVYGFQVRGPLDLIYLGWLDEACEGVPISKWVDTLQQRIAELTDLSVARRKLGKDKQRESLNRNRVDRVLKEDELVLMKVPGRSGAFQSSWEGPFKVTEVLSRVNYRVKGDGLPAEGRVVHINNLKVYRERRVYRAVVAVEESADEIRPGNKNALADEPCIGFNAGQLNKVLDEFREVFSESPGCATDAKCTITIKEGAEPVNLPVRRIPFSLRDGVRAAIDKMVEDGVIERVEDSPWCSPIVPVKKPDGSVRVCVDYRALNEVTPMVRHYMPTLDELLERAGSCGVLI